MNDQIRHLENLKASTANLFRSSKVAFSYYILGVSIALFGYLINIMTRIDFATWSFRASLILLSISIITGLIAIYKDVQIKKNEFVRVDAILKQNPSDFYNAEGKFYQIYKNEILFNTISIGSFLFSLISCFFWKLYSIEVLI